MASSKSTQAKGKEGQDPKGKQSSSTDRLPFEPKSSRKKASKKAPDVPAKASKKKPRASREGGIPEVVSKRMAKRMAIFSGVPTLMGLATLPISYLLITKDIVALPNTAVLLFSLLCLGLGVAGLTYGVVSASWDESESGSLLGIQEFQVNFKRLLESWQART